MDAVQEAVARHGNIWSLETNKEMTELYDALHAPLASHYSGRVSVRKGIKYGSNDRHRLDVYMPQVELEPLLPVTVFFHGGGFTSGDNDITPSLHGNIGNFFADSKCISVLATYRLLPEAQYPSGAEDVSLALTYIQQHLAPSVGGDPTKIIAIGQSAGGAHLAMAAFKGMLADVKLKGMVLLSPPLSYDLSQQRRKRNMFQYYTTQSESDVMSKTAVSLFRDASDEVLMAGCGRLQLMIAELDSNEIIDGNFEFVHEYRARFNRLPRLDIMMGHNHISNTLGIGLPDDTVGKQILEFVRE